MAIEPNLPLEQGKRAFPDIDSATDKEWLKPNLESVSREQFFVFIRHYAQF
jgi:hypothetical protein